MDNQKQNLLLGIGLALAFIISVGLSYAYFSAQITGIENASTLALEAGEMQIEYSENSNVISLQGIYPKNDSWATKTITLKGKNTTNLLMNYELGFEIENNTFKGGQLSFSLTGEGSNGTKIADIENKAIVKPNGYMKIGVGNFSTTNSATHTYTLNFYFKKRNTDQNFNQGAIFNGKITIKDKDAEINARKELIKSRINTTNQNHTEKYCQTDNYVEGTNPTHNQVYEPTNSIYKYTYSIASGGGWTVSLKDATSTAAITEGPCTYVNNKVVNSMANLFQNSQSTSINLTNFNTSHVTNMSGMFNASQAESIDLSSFDTSKVTNMGMMFRGINVKTLDLSSFDTSNVTDMWYMFAGSSASSIDLSSFDTSNVTTMQQMFGSSQAQSLDLSSFDTSNVTNMSYMFSVSQAESLDLSSFDTSNVTNMVSMFASSMVKSLDLSSFDTTKVTNMSNMFGVSAAISGYARTQTDADRFNNVAGSLANGNNPDTNIPNTLRFTVK